MGVFDLGNKHKAAIKLRRKRLKEDARLNREIREASRAEKRAEFKRKQLESKTATARTEERFYEAKLERKQAKREASPFRLSLPSIKIKKKRQGRKLSKKRRITLL